MPFTEIENLRKLGLSHFGVVLSSDLNMLLTHVRDNRLTGGQYTRAQRRGRYGSYKLELCAVMMNVNEIVLRRV